MTDLAEFTKTADATVLWLTPLPSEQAGRIAAAIEVLLNIALPHEDQYLGPDYPSGLPWNEFAQSVSARRDPGWDAVLPLCNEPVRRVCGMGIQTLGERLLVLGGQPLVNKVIADVAYRDQDPDVGAWRDIVLTALLLGARSALGS